MLTNWFAQKNVDDMIIFVQYLFTIPFQVRSITNENNPFQFGCALFTPKKCYGALLYVIGEGHKL